MQKKKVNVFSVASDNPKTENLIPSPENPTPEKMNNCGGGSFDGTCFYVVKANGDTDYNAFKHTPKTKEELIALLDKKTLLGTINIYYITDMDRLFEYRDYKKRGKICLLTVVFLMKI